MREVNLQHTHNNWKCQTRPASAFKPKAANLTTATELGRKLPRGKRTNGWCHGRGVTTMRHAGLTVTRRLVTGSVWLGHVSIHLHGECKVVGQTRGKGQGAR